MTGDELYMRRCLELAQRGKGHTAPNPMVGAVLVYDGRIIGEEWHKAYGGPHAEVNCLDSVTQADRTYIPQSTMYVNLEPCAHYGKTPPCAIRLVQEKVKAVVIANMDPYAEVSGKGIQILREAGITVQTGMLEQLGNWLNRRFFTYHRQQRPYIILKWAQTQEGYFAPINRERFQISNEHSQTIAHKWRAEEGAILAGYSTALNDDPELTARKWQGKQPVRLITDRLLTLPGTNKIFNEAAETWIFNEIKQGKENHITYKQIAYNDELPEQILQSLYDGKILSVIVEGGAALLNKFIRKGLWDEARIFTGTRSLKDGIPAPLLTNMQPAFQAQLDDDMLRVYVHEQNPYTYPFKMEL